MYGANQHTQDAFPPGLADRMRAGASLFGAALLCTAQLLCAAEPEADPASAPAPEAPTVPADAAAESDSDIPPGMLKKLDPYHERVTGWVDNTARGIDSFFGTSEAWSTDNDSYLRVRADFRWDETDQLSNRVRPRLRLDVPTARKRLRLIIENDDPDQRSAAEEALPSQRDADRSGPTLFGIGSGFMDRWAPAWTKKVQGGIRVRLPLDPYARFIAKRTWELGGDWELSSYNRFAWFNSDGYSVKSQIHVGKPVAPRWHLQYITDLSWREERDFLEFAESANLTNVLSKRSAINYSVGVIGQGFRDQQITNYFLAAEYRRDIHRQLLFFEVIPELTFPRGEDFNPHWAVTMRLELYFRKEVD